MYSVLTNDVLGKTMARNLRAAEAIKWTPEETAFATELQSTLRTKPSLSAVSAVEDYSFGKQGFYSTDVGDVSWVVPTVGLGSATWVPGTATHSWQAVRPGECPSAIRGRGWPLRRLPRQPLNCSCRRT